MLLLVFDRTIEQGGAILLLTSDWPTFSRKCINLLAMLLPLPVVQPTPN